MLSNDPGNKPAAPKASPRSDIKAGTAEVAGTPVLDPNDGIEVAAGGGGTVNDPAGQDTKPPGAYGSDLDLLA